MVPQQPQGSIHSRPIAGSSHHQEPQPHQSQTHQPSRPQHQDRPLSTRSRNTHVTRNNYYRTHTKEQQTDIDFFGLFNCCKQGPGDEPQLYMTKVQPSELPKSIIKKDQPYMSAIRMRSRQNMPNNTYNERLVSQKLTQSRWTYL